jgi:hypothetical protein
LKKQLEERNNQNIHTTIKQNSLDLTLISNEEELETLRETVDRLTVVRVFMFSSTIHSYISIGKS